MESLTRSFFFESNAEISMNHTIWLVLVLAVAVIVAAEVADGLDCC